ncbi:MAG: hypothetical protein SFX74_11565 [Fimbriimonadaceae bacterium]|nr:hypothetical protein [Fimbriimonadaceae bacterium]
MKLETPAVARFAGEDKRIVVGPPLAYLWFVRGTLVVGIAILLNMFGFLPSPGAAWCLITGLMVVGAAILAELSLDQVTLDLRERRYRRRIGGDYFGQRTQHGSLDQLDAVQVIAETMTIGQYRQPAVTYHVLLHWKQMAAPPLLLHQDTRNLRPGARLNDGAFAVLSHAQRIANALKVPLYDNTHYASPNPLRVFH